MSKLEHVFIFVYLLIGIVMLTIANTILEVVASGMLLMAGMCLYRVSLNLERGDVIE